MSTSTIHQQSLVDAGSETRPLMLERVDRETCFNNEFDQFVAEPGEALVSVYNHFAQLMNDLARNGIKYLIVIVNTKFLNCFHPEWIKYITRVHLAKRLTEDSYDDLFDYLSQYEKLVSASRAKKLEKSHDPLALVAHTGSSSRNPSPYYVTHHSSVVDYDDDYQGDTFQNNYEDPLTSAMMILARAITQCFSNPTNNRLCTSSNTRNQAIVQEEIIEGNNVQNDAGNLRRTLRTTSSGSAANVQCYNCSENGHYARNFPKPKVRDSKYFMEQMLLAKYDEAVVTLTDEQNDFLVADATRMEEIKELSANICLMAKIQPTNIDSDTGQAMILHFSVSNIIFDEPNVDVNSDSVEYNNNVQASYELEQLARNAYKEAEKQQINANKVKQQNKVLTQQLKFYKEQVRVFEMTKGDNETFYNEFIEAD
ncbi:gag-pol polyprotein [Tanacetum coccineum]